MSMVNDGQESAESIDSGVSLLSRHSSNGRPLSPKGAIQRPTTSEHIANFCKLLWIQVIAFVGSACAYFFLSGLPDYYSSYSEAQGLRERNGVLHEENQWLHNELHKRLQKLQKDVHPYKAITGSKGYKLPDMYGKVKEQTIWSYWHHPADCDTSACAIPEHLRLCSETVKLNKGNFDYKLLHLDEVESYINRIELPVRWADLGPTQQKDALMNALLARYGGVALDLSVLLLRPLDDYWDEMLSRGTTFRGYMYRLNGQPWNHAEVTAVWFLMSRREGIFSTAVRNQVIGMGDRPNTDAYHKGKSALGDQTLLPILGMFNYTLPKCFEDPTVTNHWACPENEQRPWYKGLTGPPRNDMRILLRDPREGPLLPFSGMNMESWIVSNSTLMNRALPNSITAGGTTPMPFFLPDTTPNPHPQSHAFGCLSMRECWEDVFLQRYHTPALPGKARLLDFVKLSTDLEDVIEQSPQELGSVWNPIVSNKETFFYQWLRLAGLPEFNHDMPE